MTKKSSISATNFIGLDKEKAGALTAQLNQLLANYQLFYINTRGFHWNIAGDNFFELHLKFEEIYNDAVLKIDEIAERILTIGGTPFHTFTDYLENASIPERANISDGKEALKYVLEGYQVMIKLEREIMEMASDADDEGTSALMSDYIREQEKSIWMYAAYLNLK